MAKDKKCSANSGCRFCGKRICQCEDAMAAVADIAISGNRLQQVVASGFVSARIALACGELFSEIADIVGSAEPKSEGDGE